MIKICLIYLNVPHIPWLILVHCNIVNNDDQHDLRILYMFVPNKSFGQLLDISPKNHISKETYFRVFNHGSMVCWSKFKITRDTR